MRGHDNDFYITVLGAAVSSQIYSWVWISFLGCKLRAIASLGAEEMRGVECRSVSQKL